jgi:hypothetical protein
MKFEEGLPAAFLGRLKKEIESGDIFEGEE